MAPPTRRAVAAPARGGGGGLRGLIDNQLDAMSPRDKRLLSGLALFFGLLFIGLFAWLVRGVIEDRASRVTASKENLVLLQAMAERYEADSAKIVKAESHLAQYKGQPASAYLEKVAQDVGVRDQFTVTQQGSEVDGTVRQTSYRVELKAVALKSVMLYLHEIETSGYPLSVELARFKAGAKPPEGEKPITLSLDLLTYQLAEAP